MDRTKQWVALTALVVLAVLGLGWSLLVSPRYSRAAELQEQADAQVQANGQLQTQLAVLKAQAKDLPKEQAKLAAVAAKLPDSAAQPALLRALAGAAAQAHVEFVSVAPGAVGPVAATAAATAATAATAAAAGTTAAGTAGQLFAMPLTIKVAGGYYEVEEYLALLEDLPRALRVSGLTLAPGADPLKVSSSTAGTADDGDSLVTDITGTVFVAAGAPAATSPAVPAGTAAH